MKMRHTLSSISHAGRGLRYVITHEQNFRIQIVIAAMVIVAMFLFSLRVSEMIVILLLILLVLILELLNSALEKFVDLLKPRLDYKVEVVKDIMAAMVLGASFGALIIGLIIFWPHIIELAASLW